MGVKRLTGIMSACGPELTSRDVRDVVAMEGKAEVTPDIEFCPFMT